MRKFFLIIIPIILIAQLTVVFAAEPEPRLRVGGLTGTTGLAMVHMVDRPLVNGVKTEFTFYKSPDLLIGKLITGEVDIATLPTNNAAILYNKSVPVQLTSIIGWGVMYVVGRDHAIKRWDDLKGKEIYIPSKGTVADLLFQILARKNGVKNGEIKIQYIASPVELAQLVAAGKANLAVLPEPWVTEALERDKTLRVLFDCQKEWKRSEGQRLTYPQSCLVVQREFARRNPELIQKFLTGVESSIQWLHVHPSQGGELAAKYVQISAVAVTKGLPRCNLRYQPAIKVKSEIQSFLRQLGEFAPESIGGKVPDDAFFYQP